jgi:hypothetical protein
MNQKNALNNLAAHAYRIAKEKATKALTIAGVMLETQTKINFKANTQYGTGATAATIISVVIKDEKAIVCKVGSPSKVFAFREFGTSPHRTNTGSEEFVESITMWGKRQGMSDDEIAGVIYHIRKYGTKPKPVLYPAFYELKGKIMETIKEGLK